MGNMYIFVYPLNKLKIYYLYAILPFFLNSSTCNVAVKTYFLPVWMAKLEKKQIPQYGEIPWIYPQSFLP